MLTYQIEPRDHSRRVDSFLRNLLPKAPPSYLKKLLAAGHLTVNGEAAAAEMPLALGDTLRLKESGKTVAFLAAHPPQLDILYEDSWIVSFNKPAGLAVHRTEVAHEPNLVELGERFLSLREGPVKLRPVNRLDKGTSGALILAKNAVAAGLFGRMVKEEGLGKLYLALVSGRMKEEDLIDAPLDGKESQTWYRTVAQGNGGAVVAVYPLTGRMHQIRQHFRLINRPILGDRRYGGAPLPGFEGHALHSLKTTLTHPAVGETVEIAAPLPPALLGLLVEVTGEDPAAVLRRLDAVPAVPEGYAAAE